MSPTHFPGGSTSLVCRYVAKSPFFPPDASHAVFYDGRVSLGLLVYFRNFRFLRIHQRSCVSFTDTWFSGERRPSLRFENDLFQSFWQFSVFVLSLNACQPPVPYRVKHGVCMPSGPPFFCPQIAGTFEDRLSFFFIEGALCPIP